MRLTPTPPRFDARSLAVVGLVALVAAGFVLGPVAPADAQRPAEAAAPSGSDADPEPPAAFYGQLTVDGDPAPAGATVEARIGGEARGSIVTEERGTYGGPGGTEKKLTVEGTEEDEGRTVTFYVDGQKADQTATWSSGAVVELNLTAPAPPTTAPPTTTEQTTRPPATTTERTTAPPTTEQTTAPPTTEQTTAPPTTERTTAPPTTERTTAPPTTEQTTAPPTTEQTTEQPTEQPPTEQTTEQPTEQPPTEQPTEQPPTEQPTTESSDRTQGTTPSPGGGSPGFGTLAAIAGLLAMTALAIRRQR